MLDNPSRSAGSVLDFEHRPTFGGAQITQACKCCGAGSLRKGMAPSRREPLEGRPPGHAPNAWLPRCTG